MVKPALLLAACTAVAGLSQRSAAADKAQTPAAGKIDFVKDIQPILKDSCIQCHQAPPANAPGRGPGAGRPGGGGGGAAGGGGAPGGGGAGRPGGPGGGGGGGGGFARGPAGGLRLDDKAAALKGGKHGKAIVPGKADESLMYKLLKGPITAGADELHAMPKPKPREEFKALPDEQIELIKQWIDQGAKWDK